MNVNEEISKILSGFTKYKITGDGARIKTHCMYPSFDPVYIFIIGFGDGYIVHDGGGAVRAAWLHGRDRKCMGRDLLLAASRFGLTVKEDRLVAKARDANWLVSAILSVANASVAASTNATARNLKAATRSLQDRIFETLNCTAESQNIEKEYPYIGKSGKEHHFDFAIQNGDRLILIDAIAPHPASIAAKYVAFADSRNDSKSGRFAVYDSQLASEDKTLLHQVADVVPYNSLGAGVQRALGLVH